MATYRVPVLEQFSWQPPVLDKDLSEQPGSGILKGDRYIVGAAASGHWTGKENQIATAKVNDPGSAADWLFDAPSEGWHCWLLDENSLYHYTGAAWDKDDISGLESSIDSLELIDSALASTDVVQDASIDSLETVASAAISSIDSLETAKQDKGVYVSEYGAIEFTI